MTNSTLAHGSNPSLGAIQDAVLALQDREFNVKDFGAIGNGVADDTAAIQAALNAVPKTGATIYFPRGAYILTSTVSYTGTAPIVLKGDGMESSSGGFSKIKASATGTYS